MKNSTMFLLWLGAAISISEIFTGGLLAPLGLTKGFIAILVGHIIGVSLLAFGGHIAFKRGQKAMQGVVYCFGMGGGKLVALANVLQLVGWTIVMIVQAGSAFVSVMPNASFALVALALSALVLVWALLLGSPAQRLNDVAVVLVSLLCLALFWQARGGTGTPLLLGDKISMALAIELSIAMPVSWLPLIGDYSMQAQNKNGAVWLPFWGYFIGSCAMYLFGLFIGVKTGGDIFAFIAACPWRYPACAVVLLSTMTTAFLDLYSAGISSQQLVKTKNQRLPVLAIGLFAAAISAFFPVERYGDFLTAFLTAIGTVFVPVYTVLFLDYLCKRPGSSQAFPWPKLAAAVAGMAGYRLFSHLELWIPTVLSIALVAVLYLPYTLHKKGETL